MKYSQRKNYCDVCPNATKKHLVEYTPYNYENPSPTHVPLLYMENMAVQSFPLLVSRLATILRMGSKTAGLGLTNCHKESLLFPIVVSWVTCRIQCDYIFVYGNAILDFHFPLDFYPAASTAFLVYVESNDCEQRRVNYIDSEMIGSSNPERGHKTSPCKFLQSNSLYSSRLGPLLFSLR